MPIQPERTTRKNHTSRRVTLTGWRGNMTEIASNIHFSQSTNATRRPRNPTPSLYHAKDAFKRSSHTGSPCSISDDDESARCRYSDHEAEHSRALFVRKHLPDTAQSPRTETASDITPVTSRDKVSSRLSLSQRLGAVDRRCVAEGSD
jgi:hypothetical protein